MADSRHDRFLDARQTPGWPSAGRDGGSASFGRAGVQTVLLKGDLGGLPLLLAIMFLLLATSPLRAGMYACQDQTGRTNFTNVPNSSSCKPLELQEESGNWSNMFRFSPSAQYDKEIRRIATRYNIDPPLIKAIIHAESDFDNQAVSRRGAQGLMQLMPATARELQVANPFNPHENIDGGTRYFRQLLDTFHEDLVLSLAAYNAGPGLVSRTGGVPEIPETVQYIKKVLKQYKVYKASW